MTPSDWKQDGFHLENYCQVAETGREQHRYKLYDCQGYCRGKHLIRYGGY
jgi:hypothetical protein